MIDQSSFSFHLECLRKTLLRILASSIIGFLLCWIFKIPLWDFFKQPIFDYLETTQGGLIFISPLEKFFTYVKLCFWTGLFISSPFWVYDLWRFFSPGLYKKEKTMLIVFSLLSWLFFLSGILFCYFMISPFVFKFLIYFGDITDLAYLSMKEYLSFFLSLLLVFGLIFQVPLILSFLGLTGVLSSRFLKKYRSHAIVILAFFSMLLTPPDVFSMIFLLMPVYALYEASIWIIYLSEKLRKNSH